MSHQGPLTFDELMQKYTPSNFQKYEELLDTFRKSGLAAVQAKLNVNQASELLQNDLVKFTQNMEQDLDQLLVAAQKDFRPYQGPRARPEPEENLVLEKQAQGLAQQLLGADWLAKVDQAKRARDNAFNSAADAIAAQSFTPQMANEVAKSEANYRLTLKLGLKMGGPAPRPEDTPVYQPPKPRPAGM